MFCDSLAMFGESCRGRFGRGSRWKEFGHEIEFESIAKLSPGISFVSVLLKLGGDPDENGSKWRCQPGAKKGTNGHQTAPSKRSPLMGEHFLVDPPRPLARTPRANPNSYQTLLTALFGRVGS